MSATPIPPVARRLAQRERASRGDDARRGARWIALLALLAIAIWVLVAPFDGILLFVAGLAALAAYAAATHPDEPAPSRGGRGGARQDASASRAHRA